MIEVKKGGYDYIEDKQDYDELTLKDILNARITWHKWEIENIKDKLDRWEKQEKERKN